MESEIIYSIKHKMIVEFDYDGYHRITEPHVYGTKNGQYQILCYQIGGNSKTGGIPEWRLFKTNLIRGYLITNKTFPGTRPTKGPHTAFDVILALV